MSGEGPAILLLHGLTATRRYVLHGSRVVERAGYRVIAYDARGHGESGPASDPGGYGYPLLAKDAIGVLDASSVDQAVLVGHSMGAHTAVRVALDEPDRVARLVLVTPAHLGWPSANQPWWDGLADGLERGGPEGFLAAYGPPQAPSPWDRTIERVILQRLALHRDPGALADALRAVPRSIAFDGLGALAGVGVPTLVVGSRDEIDPEHPLAVATQYADRIPGARFVVEGPGGAPLAWRGGELSRTVVDFLAAGR